MVKVGAGNSTVPAIMAAVSKNQTLRTLRLVNCDLGIIGADAVAFMLKRNTTLTALWLDYNSLRDVGVQPIARALKSLDLRCVFMGLPGALALADALKENTTLEKLDLYFNPIGDQGAAAIAEALKSNRTLKKLAKLP